MEIFIFLICLVFIIYYLFRPTSKKFLPELIQLSKMFLPIWKIKSFKKGKKEQFNDKNNWRGGF